MQRFEVSKSLELLRANHRRMKIAVLDPPDCPVVVTFLSPEGCTVMTWWMLDESRPPMVLGFPIFLGNELN